MNFKQSTAALASVSLFALAAPAMAQEAQPVASADQGSTDTTATPDASGDIVVTAQRRTERVVDVPISITVANQAQLERQQVNSFNDLNRIAPSLEIQSAPGQNTGGGGAIRGIGTQTFSPGAVASVGVVVDQVSQGNANIGDIFDVARVEVLKGPQGTLFGLTTSAGVINITTNAPDPSAFSGRIRTELSDAGTAGSRYGQQVVQGVINIPTSTNSALRVSGLANLRQGVNRNTLTGDLNDNDRYAVRGRFLWRPTGDVTVNLIGDYAYGKSNGEGDFFTLVKAGGPGILPLPTPFPVPDSGVANQLASCGIVARRGNRDYCTNQDLRSSSRNWGTSLELDYDAGPVTLTSITAYRNSVNRGRGSNIFRADPLELRITGGATHSKVDLFTQELRLSSPGNQKVEYTVGAFYSHSKAVVDPSFFLIELRPFPGLVIPIVNTPGATSDVVDESAAVFGQATFHATDALRLIAGGRYTHAKLSLDRVDVGTNAASSLSNTSNKISWRFGGQYDLAHNAMAYATVSRGFKGAQIATPALPLLPYVVKPEVPTAYELGVKSTLFGGWIMDANLFYQDVRNFQAQSCTVNATTGGLSCVQANIDGVKSKGAEINFFGRVARGFSLNTGFIFTDASYPKNYIGADNTNIGGSQLAYAPKYKFTLSGEYEQAVTSGLKGFLGFDAVWKSRIRYEANSVRDTTMAPHWTVGGRLGIRDASDRFSAAIFARNLFNVHEPSLFQSSFPYGGAANVGAIYGPQSFRQIGISLDAKF